MFNIREPKLLHLHKAASAQMAGNAKNDAVDAVFALKQHRRRRGAGSGAADMVDQLHRSMRRRDGGGTGFFQSDDLPAARDRVLDASGDLSVGQLVAFNIYVAMLIQPLRMLGMIIGGFVGTPETEARLDEVKALHRE